MIDPTKTSAEVIADGILPCGHPAEREEDKIIIDCCFECGWKTALRAASDDLNEIVANRGRAEAELMDFVRSIEWKKNGDLEERYLIQYAREVRVLFLKEERQKEVVKELSEENAYPC